MKIVAASFTLVVLAAACAAAPAPAAANPPAAAAASPLDALLGNWEGGGTFTFVKEGKTLPNPHVVMHCGRAGAGPSVLCNFVCTADGGFRLEEQELYGYDHATDAYHVFTVNNFGEAYDHTGRFDANGGKFDYRAPRDGKTFHEEYRFEWRSPNEMVTYGTDDMDGDVFVRGILTAHRVP
jgi:hypothetical protein